MQQQPGQAPQNSNEDVPALWKKFPLEIVIVKN